MKNSTIFKKTVGSTSMPSNSRGQGLTEYAIILSLVAIAAITAASYFGDTVKSSFTALGSELSGAAEYDEVAATQAARNRSNTSITTDTTLRNYKN